jgi:hypothetical protein
MLHTPRTLVRARPSKLVHELAKFNGALSVELSDEPRAMEVLMTAMPHLRLRAVYELDLGRLERCERRREERPGRGPVCEDISEEDDLPMIPAFFRAALQLDCLTHLRLGKACIDQASGADDYGKWDVEYVCEALPHFKCLRSLCLSGLELVAADGWDILKACRKCKSLKELDLSNNSLHELSDVVEYVDVACGLDSLNLSCNALGEFDNDSVGADLTAGALVALITQYTSLTHLDLSSNAMGNREGLTIAETLCKVTHLKTLNLCANSWSSPVDDRIESAWRVGGLLL